MGDDLCSILNNHSIFKQLNEHLKSKEIVKSLRLFTYRNDIIYLWNSFNKCLESMDIKLISKDNKDLDVVSFVPKPSLYFDVEHVLVNSTSTVCCFYGGGGIAVCRLPDRWLIKENCVDIISDFLAHRIFICDHQVLRCALWHPGSPSDSHIVMLTSDEVLRCYNVLDCSLAWEIRLTERNMRRNLPSKASIGETPVHFDFGSPERLNNGEIYWPVYILWGNGDVFKVDTQIESTSNNIDGPLRYEPAVEDNYGTDASSILVLNTQPPIVIVATCGGAIHHCILVSEDNETILHVVETIELEIGIIDTSQNDEDVISCPFKLEKDPNQISRYFCFHELGIHSISVPLVERLTEGNFSFEIDKIASSTDYLLCTGLNGEILNIPTLGVAYMDLTKIIVLLSNGELVKLLLLNHSESPTEVISIENLPVSKIDDFKSIVEALLRENGVSTFPLVKLSKEGIKAADMFKVVTRATGSLRSVLKCHSDVVLKIQQKADLLKLNLSKQMKSMEKLNDDRNSLRSTAEQIAERYEEINDKQNELIKRAELLLMKFECDSERTTANEKRMSELLKRAKAKLSLLENDISAVQSFYSRLEQNDNKQSEDKELHSGSKVELLYKHTKYLTSEVKDLSKRVENVKETVSKCQYLNIVK